jgi:CO/xanthine dehydrogenase FAD-binding subunit
MKLKFYKPNSLSEALLLMQNLPKYKYLLAGGSDLNILLRQNRLADQPIIVINHLTELKKIYMENDFLYIGATATIREISSSMLIKSYCPFFAESLSNFASPPIANFATLAGNIANSSPTADSVPLLLVLNAEIILKSATTLRCLPISQFYSGYKKNALQFNEIIASIRIPLLPIEYYRAFYIKIGSRPALSIAKLSLALILYKNKFRIAAGSLNEFPKRLDNVEKYLAHCGNRYLDDELKNALIQDITPITDFRSDKEYRLQVCCNYLKNFIDSALKPITRSDL